MFAVHNCKQKINTEKCQTTRFHVDLQSAEFNGAREKIWAFLFLPSLRQLRQIRYSVPTATLQMLVVGLVHSRLDCENSVLVGLPAYLLRQLQSVLNAASRLVYHLKARDHITDALISRAPEGILYKTAVLTYTTLPQFASACRRRA